MLKNGAYRIQSPTGQVSNALLFGPDGKLIGHVRKMNIELDPACPDVQGFIEMTDGEVHRIHRVKLSAQGLILDGEPKENPGGSSRQMDFEDLMPKN